jgi:hypothetical protein
MKYLFVEKPEEINEQTILYLGAAQMVQKKLAHLTNDILAEAPYAKIVMDKQGLPKIDTKEFELSGELLTRITNALRAK